MADRVVGRAGNALRAARNTGRFVADILNSFATANSTDIANTAGIENPSRGQGTGYIVLEDRGHPRQANQKVRWPTKTFSSVRPPPEAIRQQGVCRQWKPPDFLHKFAKFKHLSHQETRKDTGSAETPSSFCYSRVSNSYRPLLQIGPASASWRTCVLGPTLENLAAAPRHLPCDPNRRFSP